MAIPTPKWLDAPLAQALANVRGHAVLLHGPAGVGQFELAIALASAWLCEAPHRAVDAPACGECASCRLIAARTHPDLCVLLPEALQEPLGWRLGDESEAGEGGKGAKPSKEIRIDAMRAAIAFTQQTAARGGAKLLVIHPAERMNHVTANTLLKTLEEPPGRVRFVLSSAAPARLLPTVRSRCQGLQLSLPPAAAARDWLAQQGVPEPDVLLAAAGGRPQAALDLHALGVTAASWRALPAEVRAGRWSFAADWPLPLLVESLGKLCDDALRRASGAPPRFFPADAVPADGDLLRLTAWGQRLRQAARHAEHPWKADLAAEALVGQARRALFGRSGGSAIAAGPRVLATLRP
ncbi:DNA polymerase III subunit delta' [Caldimonas sp. KR1-144]|uniref:DNA polymerase III subunit delta' n=1 Tax=Caldimonas sp. KR1-144 TaxID=3400911 RepID=UPI003BFF96F9